MFETIESLVDEASDKLAFIDGLLENVLANDTRPRYQAFYRLRAILDDAAEVIRNRNDSRYNNIS